MKKIRLIMIVAILVFTVAGTASAAGNDENKLSLEVFYEMPYNSDSACNDLAIGLVYPVFGILRVSADAQFKIFKNEGKVNPPSVNAGVGLSIPAGGIRLIVDFKKGFDIGSGGVKDYGDILDMGVGLPLTSRASFRSYFREIKNIPAGKQNYLALGFDYKL